MELKDRIKQYCSYVNIAISRFEKESGLSNGYFNQVKKRPSEDKLEGIFRAFPDINTAWLLTGEGEMLKAPKNPFSQMTERKLGESISEVIMEMYTKGEIYPASIYDKAIAEKNKELSARDRRIEELQREVWRLQNQVDDLSK